MKIATEAGGSVGTGIMETPGASTSSLSEAPATQVATRRQRLAFGFLALVLLIATLLLRVPVFTSFDLHGFDEVLYASYVVMLEETGLAGYPDVVAAHLEHQAGLDHAVLPPTRFLYIYLGYTWQQIFGLEPFPALHAVSCFFSVLMVPLSLIAAARMSGSLRAGAAVGVLMLCAPTQIHMSQHALIDGVVAFWATLSLWLLFESMQRGVRPAVCVLLLLAATALILTKENAAFVYVGLVAAWVTLACLIRPERAWLPLATLGAAGVLALLILFALCGGVGVFVEIYQTLVAKAYQLPYAIYTGDGPWYRYLVDLMTMSPVVLMFAIAGALGPWRREPGVWAVTAFVLGTYLVMVNIKYGMNLRYACIWDLPLRLFAVLLLGRLCLRWQRGGVWLFWALIFLVCLQELRQYRIFFIDDDLYELISLRLQSAVNIIKLPGGSPIQ